MVDNWYGLAYPCRMDRLRRSVDAACAAFGRRRSEPVPESLI